MSVIIARTFIIYTLLLLFMRLSGKRQLGQLELSEFILASLAADMASHPLESLDIPLLNGIIPLICLFCFEILLVRGGLKCGRFRELIYGRPSILIKNGSVIERELRKNRISIEELLAQLRSQGVEGPEKIQYAVLETDGSLSLIKFPQGKPQELKRLIIADGRLIERELKAINKDESWLNEKLKELELQGKEQLFMLLSDSNGEMYLIKKEKK